MNILEYIDQLIAEGRSEEDAEICAYYQFSDDYSEEDY